MPRTRFEEQLKLLHTTLIQLGALCEDAINAAAKALLTGDQALVKKAMEAEQEIDRLESEIEALCFKLLLHQQPVASDLREISAALKMISDLERIGDQAADIAELTEHINIPLDSTNLHIADMTKAVIKMVTESIDAFVRKDIDLARKVMADDDVVDTLFDQIKGELETMVKSDAASISGALDLLMVVKYLERIGDHATNVAEWVEYSITGVHPEGN
ncbi:phosphate signaling complex protein PhoU [Bengtsoniella intestinalis]|uniref:phosphate signaling complex protein PhoU n=1 Tax=Bengtsoniella intestinalis TaxID=3073143 RepID=UPI00391F8A20